MNIERAAELPAARARTMAWELREAREAIYAGHYDVACEILRGFRAHMAFLEAEIARLESMVEAALAKQEARAAIRRGNGDFS